MKPTDISRLHNLDITQYNNFLDAIKVFKFCLYQPTMNQPTRFCIVSETEFNVMIINPRIYLPESNTKNMPGDKKPYCELKLISGGNGNTKFLYGITNLSNVMLPGVCVSMWRHSTNIQDISQQFTDAVEKSFGRGFGGRSCAP